MWEIKDEAKGREFGIFLRTLEQFIHTVKGDNNFEIDYYFNFKITLEQLKCQLEQIVGILKTTVNS